MTTAQMILEDLTHRGFTLEAHGDKVRVAPREALTDEIRQAIRTHRQEILALLHQGVSRSTEAPLPAHDPASPWPLTLPGYGAKTLGPFTPCLLCQTGTWARYGCLPLCLACARKAPAPLDPQIRLRSLLTTWATLDEDHWTQEAVDTLKDSILDLFRDYPEADAWFKEWREIHPGARLC